MIRIESSHPLPTVSLGEIVEFRIVGTHPAIEARFFLKQGPVLYTKPLTGWEVGGVLRFFAEAPGTYTLAVQWRPPESVGGAGGWEETSFEVLARRALKDEPYKVRIDGLHPLWAPNRWNALEVKRAEDATLKLLPRLVRPGTVVYDIGANLGRHALRLARLAGEHGKVYCLEANPICVQFLKTNVTLNGMGNVVILPVAALDRIGETSFTVNYGNSNLGLSEESLLYPVKTGHEIRVPCSTLDDLIDRFSLLAPEVVKIDVEGSEHLVIEGMRGVLGTRPPTLVLELHGEGNAHRTLTILDGFGYRYVDPESRETLRSAAEVCRCFGNRVFQLLGLPEGEGVPVFGA